VSRRIHRADLALTSEGYLIVNLACFEDNRDVAFLLQRALAQPGEVFIGVTINATEVSAVLSRLDNAAAEAAAAIAAAAARQRRRRGKARNTRKKAS